jgi:hypothetical protein
MDSTSQTSTEMNNNKKNDTATQLAETLAFVSNVPANATLSQFADAIQSDPVMRKNIPDMDAQVDALRKFEKGQLTYAEMRTLCG